MATEARPVDIEALKSLADSGDAVAQCELGVAYMTKNSGVEFNLEAAKSYLEKSAEQGYAEGQYRYGTLLQEQKDDIGAFEQFKKAAGQGNDAARLRFARLLKSGKSTPRNYEEAARLFKASADGVGNGYAQYEYGDCLRKGLGVPKNMEEAEKYFKESAKSDFVYGKIAYAEILEKRSESDKERAVILYKQAITENNSPFAMYCLGKCYREGIGVTKNPAEAVKWFAKAANDVPAAAMLYGQCFESGDGVEKNPQEAAQWFKKAAEMGMPEAALKYSECLAGGKGVPRDRAGAQKWFEMAVKTGNEKWLYTTGMRLIRGDSVNVRNGACLLEASANKGYPKGMVQYGILCGSGTGVPQDPSKSVELYHQAALKGNADGLYRYAICLEYGHVVEKDLAQAESLYSKAIAAGNCDACFYYGRLQERKGDFNEALKWYKQGFDKKSPLCIVCYGTYMDNGVLSVPLSDPESLAQAFDEAQECIQKRLDANDAELELLIDEVRKLRNRTKDNDFSYLIMASDRLEIIQKIGSGQYGTVSLVRDKETGELWAAKFMPSTEEQATMETTVALRETSLLAKLEHPCILRVKGVVLASPSSSEWVVATEYMEHNSLAQLLEQVRRGEADPNVWNHTTITVMIVGIVLGMRYVHRQQVLHRDLKPSNILLDKDYHPRISDFGLSREYDRNLSDDTLTRQVGTPLYMAPEMFQDCSYSNKVDVFSFGLVLYEMITGKRAFSESSVYAHVANLVKGERPMVPDSVIPEVQDLMRACWSEDESARPTFDDIYTKLRMIEFKVWDDTDSEVVNAYVIDVTQAERQTRLLSMVDKSTSW